MELAGTFTGTLMEEDYIDYIKVERSGEQFIVRPKKLVSLTDELLPAW